MAWLDDSLVETEAYQDDENRYKRRFVSDASRLMVFIDKDREGAVVGFQFCGEAPLNELAGSPEIVNFHLDMDGDWKVGHSGMFSGIRFLPVSWIIDEDFISSFKERAVNLDKSLTELIVARLERIRQPVSHANARKESE